MEIICGKVRKDEAKTDIMHYDVNKWMVDTKSHFSGRKKKCSL